MENKDEILRELRAELAKAGSEYLQLSAGAFEKTAGRGAQAGEAGRGRDQRSCNEVGVPHRDNDSEEEGNWTPTGIDQVVYMIATNPGEPMRQLEHIASGGELSRVMLALKVSVESGPSTRWPRRHRRQAAQRTMVFDEIDTGIGGRAAEAVGKKLKALARSNQVLCVTHLPQIATFADHHYVIEKKERNGRTRTSIRAVVGEERTEEVARMLSGAKLTDTSRKHAEQMIKANG